MSRCMRSLALSGTILVSIGLLAASVAFAAIEGGDAKKGRTLTREQCKGCHTAGAEGGTMTPLSKTQRQWERFYVKEKHETVAPGTWSKISQADIKDIMQFMYDHAADSEQPDTCGQ